MKLAVQPPLPPMEARLVEAIPEGEHWQYEPKWDGFRCLVFRDGDEIYLQSKSGQPLGRYFPEMTAAMRALAADRFVLDGEMVIPRGRHLSFDDLLLRIHPAESRVRKLATETPSLFVAFDLLLDSSGNSLLAEPLRKRRALLERFAKVQFEGQTTVRLSPVSYDLEQPRRWLTGGDASLDGVIAKDITAEYRSGERIGMQKVKVSQT